MKALQDIASMLFIVAVEVLAIVSVLGIWEVFASDVVEKSIITLGLLAFVSVIVLVAGRFMEIRAHDAQAAVEVPNPIFTLIRQITLAVLIALASLLALVGVLSIWEVIPDQEVLFKVLGTLGIFAFAAFVIVMTCLVREKAALMGKGGQGMTLGGVVVGFFLLYILLSVASSALF